MRALVAVLFAVAVGNASAAPYVRPRPPRPITAAELARLVEAVKAESFTDGKLEQVRRAGGGRYFLFTGAQAISVLQLFEFWADRLSALRLLPITGGEDANAAVLRYFDAAPGVLRDEARRILGGSD